MSETRFLISEAARMVDVETHVLRYWEEELALRIARNEMGHRYYTREDIQIFLSIKELKKKGFQLKTIKELVPGLRRELYANTSRKSETDAKKGVIENDSQKKEPVVEKKKTVSERKEEKAPDKKQEFYQILDRLLTQIKDMDHQEDRYKRLDAAIRHHQYSRRMVAATKEQGKKRKKKFSKPGKS